MLHPLQVAAPILCMLAATSLPAQTPSKQAGASTLSNARSDAPKPLLMQKPTLSKTRIVFSYAGNLWSVSRSGGIAQRLTSGTGPETDPIFSPDGHFVAFTGEYNGNADVYIVPAEGGVPRRLTAHPEIDSAVGWTPDGKSILFRSRRRSYQRFWRLYTVPTEGGFATEIPLPMAVEGSYSPTDNRIAYVPLRTQAAWKRYRGGQTTSIRIARLADSSVEELPRHNSNDFNPMWVGDRIYFLSDRDGPVTLYAFDMKTKTVKRLIRNDGFDFKSASLGPGAIIYEQLGSLGLYDLKTGEHRKIEVRIDGDFPGRHPRYVKLAGSIQSARLSPSGTRVVVTARGEVFTLPIEKGDPRNLTNSPGVRERDASWSPDGRSIAYFSDESGEYALYIRPQDGTGVPRRIDIEPHPSLYKNPIWSPDSKKIAFLDKRLALWIADVESGATRKLDHDTYYLPSDMTPAWSPDSSWIAYSKLLKNRLGAIFVYSVKTGVTHQLTDGMSHATMPVFDRNGKYLYFAASVDAGLTVSGDMSTMNRPMTRNAYVVVLRRDLPSPLAPESDEEKPKDDATKAGEKKPESVKIDFEKIHRRILALPIPARRYISMVAGKEEVLFLLEEAQPGSNAFDGMIAHRFDLTKRKMEKTLEGLDDFSLSANGERILYRQGDRLAITSTDSPKADARTLNLDALQVRVDPTAEWRQMFNEVWRNYRDYFYDPDLHGLDIAVMKARYEPFLAGIASRADLNYLFSDMLGELTCGHIFVLGGDLPEVKRLRVGLLGADYTVDNGRYRFARIYDGENWNPDLKAPLTQPGVDVKEGEYLLAVNGSEVKLPADLYSFFEETVGKQTKLTVGPNPDGKDSREVTVIPIESELRLRQMAWIEDNRRKVDRLSEGKIAYVFLQDTAGGGFENFNRYFFAQVGKEGVVLDERFNGGGSFPDHIIANLGLSPVGYWMTREGEDYPSPHAGAFGPKALITNELSSSGGDILAWLFRQAKLGPLIGKRTWGGAVGYVYPPDLIDGGVVTVPNLAFFNPIGEWNIENHGVAPDIEVEMDPKSWREGHDLQLETAVKAVLDQLKKHPLPVPKRPRYPNYHQ